LYVLIFALATSGDHSFVGWGTLSTIASDQGYTHSEVVELSHMDLYSTV